jgi:hypothetical protein
MELGFACTNKPKTLQINTDFIGGNFNPKYCHECNNQMLLLAKIYNFTVYMCKVHWKQAFAYQINIIKREIKVKENKENIGINWDNQDDLLGINILGLGFDTSDYSSDDTSGIVKEHIIPYDYSSDDSSGIVKDDTSGLVKENIIPYEYTSDDTSGIVKENIIPYDYSSGIVKEHIIPYDYSSDDSSGNDILHDTVIVYDAIELYFEYYPIKSKLQEKVNSDPDWQEEYTKSIHDQFIKYQLEQQKHPTQLIRYGKKPLFYNKKMTVECCGMNCDFLFQIMNYWLELMHFNTIDDLMNGMDWATVLVFNCKKCLKLKTLVQHE